MKFLKSIKKDEIMATVTRTASKYGYKLKKASPTIMIAGAAIGGNCDGSGLQGDHQGAGYSR